MLAAYVCWRWRFDALSKIILTDSITLPGTLITAGVVAGGSHASIKLFRDVLGFQAEAEKEVAETKKIAKKEKERDAEAERIKAALNTGASK
jgi:hypothetical protein